MPKAKPKPTGKLKETTDKAGEMARSIWLAGLGAYGKAYDEAVSRYEKASKDTPKLFRELVKKGEMLESDSGEKSPENTLTRARADIEERLQAVKENLGFSNLFGGSSGELKRIEEKLDALNAKVDTLAKAMAGNKAKARPAAATRKRKRAP